MWSLHSDFVQSRKNKMSLHCNIKDCFFHDQNNHVIYIIKCPGCSGFSIGKTETFLTTKITNHGKNDMIYIYMHIYIFIYIYIYLNISLNVNCLQIDVGCLPLHHNSMKMNITISLGHYIFLKLLNKS